MSHENPAANNFTENKGGRRSNELGWERLRDEGWGGVLCHMLCHMLCRGLSVSNVVLRDSASETRHFSNSAIEFKGGLGKCSLALSRWGNPTRAIPLRILPQTAPNQAKPYEDSESEEIFTLAPTTLKHDFGNLWLCLRGVNYPHHKVVQFSCSANYPHQALKERKGRLFLVFVAHYLTSFDPRF